MSPVSGLRPVLLALAIGIGAGVAGFSLGMPLPWMLGPMVATTLAAPFAWPVRGPDRLRPFVIPVIGVLLGASITPEIVGQLGSWAVTLALLPVYLLVAAAVSYAIYRGLGRYDPTTAFYAAMPGGLNEMLLLGAAAGGDERKIATAHAARVLFTIFFVVLYFALALGVRSTGGGALWVALDALSLWDYAALGFCAVAGAWLGKRLRLPAAPVFGPMILSGALHLTEVVKVAPPSLIVIAAQIVIGTVIGARFIGTTFRSVGRDILLAILATLAMLAVTLVCAELIAATRDMPLSQAFLGFAPGGLTEMSLLSLTLGQDVAFVSVTHVIRIMLVIAAAPFAFRLLRR